MGSLNVKVQSPVFVDTNSIKTLSAMKLMFFVISLVGVLIAGAFSEEESVKLSLYYETKCPFCKDFIVNQIAPTYEVLGDSLEIEFKPFGNAKFEADGDSWKFTCQHGPKECHGNMIQACLIHVVEKQELVVPLIKCAESGVQENEADAVACFGTLDIDAETREQFTLDFGLCMSNDAVNLLHEIGVETNNLEPKHQWVPWPLYNGIWDEDDFEESAQDLQGFLCRKFLPNHPAC